METMEVKSKLMNRVPAGMRNRIWAIDDEREGGGNILIHYRRRFRSCVDFGLHIDSAETVKEMWHLIMNSLPCGCSDCETGRGWSKVNS